MQKIALMVVALLGSVSGGLAAELVEVGNVILPPDSPIYDTDKKRREQSGNLSGLFCPAADWCVVVSDEKRGLHRLDVARGSDKPVVSYAAGLKLEWPSEEFFGAHGIDEKPKELDLEAVASTDDTVFFIGSHANKRKKGDKNPGSHLIAIASVSDLKSNTELPAKWTSLNKLFKKDGILGDVLDKQLQCGGLNIEGATVAGADLLIGVRIPSRGTDGTNSAAYVVSTPVAGLLNEDFSGAKLHALPTDQPFIGIRAMETVGRRRGSDHRRRGRLRS